MSIPAMTLTAVAGLLLILFGGQNLAKGGIVPLQSDQGIAPAGFRAVTTPTRTTEDWPNIGGWNDSIVVVPIVETETKQAPAPNPTAVPLPPALETGISGGVTMILFAGIRKLRRKLKNVL